MTWLRRSYASEIKFDYQPQYIECRLTDLQNSCKKLARDAFKKLYWRRLFDVWGPKSKPKFLCYQIALLHRLSPFHRILFKTMFWYLEKCCIFGSLFCTKMVIILCPYEFFCFSKQLNGLSRRLKKVAFLHLVFFSCLIKVKKRVKLPGVFCRIWRGKYSIAERTVRECFIKFKQGNFNLNNASRSGRPIWTDKGQLRNLLRENAHQT